QLTREPTLRASFSYAPPIHPLKGKDFGLRRNPARAVSYTLNFLPETPSPASPPAANNELGQVLSPSQLEKWRDCQASWHFRYVRRLEDITDGNRALGKAVHKAAEVYARVW